MYTVIPYYSLYVFSLCLIGVRGYELTLYQSGNNSMQFSWTVNYETQRIEMNLLVALSLISDSDVIGIGFSERGFVTNADVVIVHRNQDGVTLLDSWTDAKGRIMMDEKHNYYLSGYQVDVHTFIVSFWRYVNTNDDKDYQLDNGTTHVIYIIDSQSDEYCSGNSPSALGNLALTNTIDSRHINALSMQHGFIRVQLLKPEIPASYFGSDLHQNLKNFSIVQNNIKVPAQVTTYWCSIHVLPDTIKGKIHAIGYTATLSEPAGDFIHHMEVFACVSTDGIIQNYSGLCDVQDEPVKVKRCNRVVAAWAKGASPLYYPKQAGLPFGGKNQSRYFRLEIHYNNPRRKEGFIDSSGIQFFYTENLRPNDIGILEVGLTYSQNMIIPPTEKSFQIKGYCIPFCTDEGIQSSGISIVASQLHTHLAGRKIWTSHVRDGVELPEINRDDHYSTWFEEIRQVYPPIRVFPGDSLITTCSYDTRHRKEVTLGGKGIFDEMCVSYLHYYPASSLEVCKSSVSLTSLMEYFLIEKLSTGYPRTLNFREIYRNYFAISWNNNAKKRLETLYEKGAIDVECHEHDGSQFPGHWTNVLP